jgi:transposase-like protein
MKRHVRRGDPQRQSHWQEVVRRWREGGQSVRDFCHAEGLRESAFYFWRRELTRRDGRNAENAPQTRPGPKPPTRRSRQRVARQVGPTPSFLPVRVVTPEMPARGVEIVLERGRSVRVPPGFDRETLAHVLALLETRPC